MNLAITVITGVLCGALGGVGIFFVPQEPYRTQVFFAATLRGVLVSLLAAFSLNGDHIWWHGVGWGVLYGLATAMVVFLAKGGFKSKDAPFVLPISAIMGALNGLLLVALPH